MEHSGSAGRWIEVADGVWVRRYAELDQTLGLVVGEERCLVVDTGRDERHGAEFAASVRQLTALPWAVVISHAHFDHFFGTASFLPCPVWAHPRCPAAMSATADQQRAEWAETFRAEGKARLAADLERARLELPTQPVDRRVDLDLGDRTVSLSHPGRGHTDHDVVVHVPDARVLFAGDLVEQGAPPSVGKDAFPAEWPATLDTLLALRPAVVVPGHGDPVGPDFVRHQRAHLSRLQ